MLAPPPRFRKVPAAEPCDLVTIAALLQDA
jgi:hypothetical protein